MRSDYRKQALEMLERLWSRYPDMRLGQLMSNVATRAEWYSRDLFYLEDEQLAKGLRSWLEDNNPTKI